MPLGTQTRLQLPEIFSADCTSKTILCPRAGGNLVQKQFMLLNDFLLQLSRAGASAAGHSIRTLRVFSWPAGSKITYPKEGTALRPGSVRVTPPGLQNFVLLGSELPQGKNRAPGKSIVFNSR